MHRDATSTRPRTGFALALLWITALEAGTTFTLPAPSFAAPPEAPEPPRPREPGDVPASTFGLTPPVRIAFCDEDPLDGTVGVGLMDRRGRTFLCGLSGSRGGSVAGRREPASRPLRVFVGATYPTRPGARPLPLWGPEERALIRLLTAAIADSISDAQNDLLLKGASSGVVSDPRGYELLRLIGSVQRRSRMLAAISNGEVAPAPDAFAYFGLRGPLTLRRIGLTRAGRFHSIAISDTAGLEVIASLIGNGRRAKDGAWSVDVGRARRGLYIPLGGYEERYLLTVLSAAIRASEGGPVSGKRAYRAGDSLPDSSAIKAAVKTILERKKRIREEDRFS